MFCTGVENSVPTIHGGRTRIDEMESCGHYEHWHKDFSLVSELGIQFLRYGPEPPTGDESRSPACRAEAASLRRVLSAIANGTTANFWAHSNPDR
jgi:hypothetical protein